MTPDAATPLTEVVALPAGKKVNWVPNRKVWLGASVGTSATALGSVSVWVLHINGVEVPLDIGASFVILLTGLLAVALYFASAYWVTEPPTS